MKKQMRATIAIFLLSTIAFTGCNNHETQTSDGSSSAGDDNTKETTVLKGRYINTDNGIRSLTFKTDGTFERGGAVSGTVGGTTDYVAGTHNAGNYKLNGGTISLTYENGDTEDLPIEIFPSTEKDAKPETPFRISVNHVFYVYDDMF